MVTSSFAGRIIQSDGAVVLAPVGVRLTYSPDTDPLAVTMTFLQDDSKVVWTVGLDLLQEGVTVREKVGEGDVGFRLSSSRDKLLVCLKSPEGHADLGFPLAPVVAFLGHVQAASASCSVALDNQIDDLIEEILNS